MPDNSLALLEARKDEILANLSAEQPKISWWTVAMQSLNRAMQRSPQLRDCTRESIIQSLLDIAAMNLHYDNKEAHIIPYGKTAQGEASYRGLIKIAIEAGAALHLGAEIIYEGEPISPSPPGLNGRTLNHQPVLYLDKKPRIVGAYAYGVLPHNIMDYTLLRIGDIEAIKKAAAKSQGLSPAWREWEEEMLKKSAIKRFCKNLKGDRNTDAGRRFEDMKRAELYDEPTPPLSPEEMPRAAEPEKGGGAEVTNANTAASATNPPSTPGGRVTLDEEQLALIDENSTSTGIAPKKYRQLMAEFGITDEHQLLSDKVPAFLERMHQLAGS